TDAGLSAPWTGNLAALAVRNKALAQVANGSPYALWGATIFGPDQEAWVTFAALGTAPEHDLFLKCQGTTWNAGVIEVDYDVRQKKVTVSTYTPVIGWKACGSIAQALAAGDQLGARAFAN